MSGFSNPLIGGGGALVYPSIHSPNFVTTVSGWSINKDGTAEFNSVTIRNGQVVSGTALYYSGTPAAGNLIASISSVAGADSFGNPYKVGIETQNPNAFIQIFGSQVTFGSQNALTTTIAGALINFGDATTPGGRPELTLHSPAVAAGATELELTLFGQSQDATGVVQMLVAAGSAAALSTALLEVQGTLVAGHARLQDGAGAPAFLFTADPAAANTDEAIHQVSSAVGFVNNWLAGGRVPPSFRLVASPPNTVDMVGSLTVPAGFAAGQAITAAFAVAYRPVAGHTQSIRAHDLTNDNTVWLHYGSGGVLTFDGPAASTAAGHILDYEGRIYTTA